MLLSRQVTQGYEAAEKPCKVTKKTAHQQAIAPTLTIFNYFHTINLKKVLYNTTHLLCKVKNSA